MIIVALVTLVLILHPRSTRALVVEDQTSTTPDPGRDHPPVINWWGVVRPGPRGCG